MSNRAPAVVEQDPGDRLPATPTRLEGGGSNLPPWQHGRATRAKNFRDGAIPGAAAPQRTPPRMRDGRFEQVRSSHTKSTIGCNGRGASSQKGSSILPGACALRQMDPIKGPRVLSGREQKGDAIPLTTNRHATPPFMRCINIRVLARCKYPASGQRQTGQLWP